MAIRVLLLSLCCLGVLGDTHNSSGPYSLRLEGGASRCQGEVHLQRPGLDWTPVDAYNVPLEFGSRVCSALDCGSALSLEKKTVPAQKVVEFKRVCEETELIHCFMNETYNSDESVELNCSDSVRLVGGSGLCSGSLQIWDQSWTSVCEGALDLRGAEVLCRELGCEAPSVPQGELSPLAPTFHCEGHESALMDYPRSRPKTYSSGPSMDIICSEPLRVGESASRCAGVLELRNRGEWRRVWPDSTWLLEQTAAVCRDLDCGSALSDTQLFDLPETPLWQVTTSCLRKSPVRQCATDMTYSSSGLKVECSDHVRLVGGPGLCSGSLQIWDQSWISVCEGALDLQGAEVLCRELDCGAPSVLQGELSPLGPTFHCEGHESSLMHCPRSRPKICSSGPSMDIICSEPLRLVGGASRCAGIVELKHRAEWRRVMNNGVWIEGASAAVCRDLDCGSAVSGNLRDDFPNSPVWRISAHCTTRRKSKVKECVADQLTRSWLGVEVMCSDLLNRPVLSLSVTVGVSQVHDSQVHDSQVQFSQVQDSQVQDSQVQDSQVGQVVHVQLGSQFLVQCSVKPQFPGGFFQLLSPSGNHTLPAVNHSAHFLFNHTGPAHIGDYTCVYHQQVFNHSFSSESERLELRLGVLKSDLIIRVLIILLMILLFILPICYCYYKAKSRRGTGATPQNMIPMNEVIADTIELH